MKVLMRWSGGELDLIGLPKGLLALASVMASVEKFPAIYLVEENEIHTEASFRLHILRGESRVIGNMWDFDNETCTSRVGEFWNGIDKTSVNYHLRNFLYALMGGMSRALVN